MVFHLRINIDLCLYKTSINLLSNFIHSLDNPHGLTGSWAIIPFINDVFSIEHDYSRALKYFGDIVNPGLYDYLKQKTIEMNYTNILSPGILHEMNYHGKVITCNQISRRNF